MTCFNINFKRNKTMDLQKLIKALQADANNNITINVTVSPAVADSVTPPAVEVPDTDFDIGDRVVICHQRRGEDSPIHTGGEVIEVLQKDDKGWYTRVLGDNGKHYRIGLHYDEPRLGSKAIVLE